MNQPAAPAVGLYSIGIRDLDVSALLTLAAANGVPFIHLRGGPKGYDLARQSKATLAAWARQAETCAPVTMVTADLDLSAFLSSGPEYLRVRDEFRRLAEAAKILGAGSARLLARQPPEDRRWTCLSLPDLAADHGLVILVELHHPAWFSTRGIAVISDLLGDGQAAGLLLDTAQFRDATSGDLREDADDCLSSVLRNTRAVHLSDSGAGLGGAGHRDAARAALSAIRSGQLAEIAFEWTGPDRSPSTCLTRYRAACAWWQHAGGLT